MSTAWYKPNSLPRKIRSWKSMVGTQANDSEFFRSIEVWETTCVVTNMNSSGKRGASGGNPDGGEENACQTPFSVLINPGNPSLSGVSRFSYFPVGGPEPPPSFKIGKDSHPIMGYVTSWGGMEVGNGMSFASNTVDGIVHQYGGKELKRECEAALSNSWTGGAKKIDEGMAISTPAVGATLREASGYNILVHTVPPFVNQDYRSIDEKSAPTSEPSDDKEEIGDHNDFLLGECYRNSLNTAASVSPSSLPLKIACPLLGAGCRGFSIERAIEIAAKTTTQWMTEDITVEEPMVDETGNNYTNNDTSERINTANASTPMSLWKSWFGGKTELSSQSGGWEGHDENFPKSITLAFGIPDSEIREKLIKAIDQEMELQVP